ncbi:Argininosuccinate lyase [Shimia thalassica]|uniref:argininosuccinate lyase n=1 Tax=Shimia thalassica TaxID=1715693 RepID=A0A0P1IFR0_9RHOB|nr:lyase family protein [Shimia thalassica]CUK10533.1 Argininosuccinate lyase [Shimia thalassica]
MKNTGRIATLLHPEARRIVFNDSLHAAAKENLPHYAEMDRAQAVMLAETGYLHTDFAMKIIRQLDELEVTDFRSIAAHPAPRGEYLAYEDALRELLGNTVSNLHLGRSRNDLSATLLKLKLRKPFRALASEVIQLVETLIDKARDNLETPLPLHTHRQPAVPSTLAHHCAGFATCLLRDLDAILALAPSLNTSCLGAGCGGGTTIAIRPKRTAELLGFATPVGNSIDAVASRDLVLRLLSALSILSNNLGRISETLLGWLGDAGLASLPDALVGSSSAMPHKRNAFLLEQVQGKSGVVTGVLMSALCASQASPFTNCVAVGTEASGQVWHGVETTRQALVLTRLCIDGLEVNQDAAFAMMMDRYVNAMEAANKLVEAGANDFRSAHAEIGQLVTQAEAVPKTELLSTRKAANLPVLERARADLTPSAIILAASHGGGPAPDAVTATLDALTAALTGCGKQVSALSTGWDHAQKQLSEAIAKLNIHASSQHA